jgi:hypothetical protein
MDLNDWFRSGLANRRSRENREGNAMRISYIQRPASTNDPGFRSISNRFHPRQGLWTSAVILGV